MIDDLNEAYARVHTAKEDAFWVMKMGLADDRDAAQRDFDAREIALLRFLQDPEGPARVRRELVAAAERGATEDELVGLRGWLRTFEAHVIESADARARSEEIVAAEGRLNRARGEMNLGYRDPDKGFVRASSVKLGTMLRAETDERLRRAAWDGLRSIEPHVLANGFLDVVRQRNRLGRMLGAEDYYDWKARRVEGLTKAQIFALLDELERATRERGRTSIDELRARVGAAQVTPWNATYLISGDVTREQDPYFPFAAAIERWGRSFAALGVDFAGADMVLDLLDRAGKYENGFMHGPVVAWRDGGRRHAARIHFTANAIPGMVGSGHRAMETLFHEGGHAAHFANVDMPAPCFGQEFAPTSVGFAETQSMFLDSLLADADWKTRYARDREGRSMPWEMIERGIRATSPFAAWGVRSMLVVCYAERAIYEIPDRELSAERVLAAIRDVERRLLFLDEGSPRPVLAVPHLLAGESSAYYHGYVLAEMAVEQTRAHFVARDGHLVDNPRVGPDLERAYWRPGNSVAFSDAIERLTGQPLGAAALAARVNRTTDEALRESRAMVDRLSSIPEYRTPVRLGAKLTIIHGRETIARLEGDFAAFAATFARWIDRLVAQSTT
ncbi:MAG: peptidase M3 [Planctomycetes bacterium]|nr:peptidase M3 [Planctomycetota bacterium]MBI3843994.1 peptidase M3 [Planctomycetota bacterium]